MNACQWASMRPGISTRPPPAMTRTSASASTRAREMRSMMLPLTSTFEGADSVGAPAVEDPDVLEKRRPTARWRGGRHLRQSRVPEAEGQRRRKQGSAKRPFHGPQDRSARPPGIAHASLPRSPTFAEEI